MNNNSELTRKDLLQGPIKKNIRIYELNLLGYLITRQFLSKGKSDRFRLYRVIDEDKREAPFCYFYSLDNEVGSIIPHEYFKVKKCLVG